MDGGEAPMDTVELDVADFEVPAGVLVRETSFDDTFSEAAGDERLMSETAVSTSDVEGCGCEKPFGVVDTNMADSEGRKSAVGQATCSAEGA